MFGFEKLEVWQKAIEYADCIYVVTRQLHNVSSFSRSRLSTMSIIARSRWLGC